MDNLFPPEIVNTSTENYYNRLSPKSRVIYWMILIMVLTILIISPFVKVDITTQARGVVRTSYENTIIQTMSGGKVQVWNMTENMTISKGDTLLIMESKTQNEQLLLEKQKYASNTQFLKDLGNMILGSRNSISSIKYQGEYSKYLSKLKEQDIYIKYLQGELDKIKNLFDKGVISQSEYLQEKNNLDRALSLQASITDEFLSTWKSEKVQLELENQILLSNIKRLEEEIDLNIVIAPSSGKLSEVIGVEKGSFIAANQQLAKISVDDSLLIECYISPKDIALIYIGQPVSFQLDAFNYQEWGLLRGHVIDIMEDVIIVDNSPMFKVRCNVNKNFLQTKDGHKGYIKKNLTLTSRLFLKRRTLFQLLFDKVNDWINPKIMNVS